MQKMNLDERARDAVQELSDAVNSAVDRSPIVRRAIERLRERGFEPTLTLRLEVALDAIQAGDEPAEAELELTADDIKALQRMKIRL